MTRGTVTVGNLDTFLSTLVDFCVDSATACFSSDANQPCVPVGLSCLSALLLLLSCSLLVYQRCRSQRSTAGESLTLLYSLLGNMCCTVGAILSRQLHIQVLMGTIGVVMDAVHVLSSCFPVFPCCSTKAERRLRVMRRRRRQHLLAVCVLMVVAGGFLNWEDPGPADRPVSSRRLLHITLTDNTEILGYVLGLLFFVIACSSRFPALHRAYRGESRTCAHMFSRLLCSLAGALYAAAILLYDTRLDFLVRVMPWLLSALCCVILDLLILVIHWCQGGGDQQLVTFSPDTESLLGSSCLLTDDPTAVKMLHSSVHTKTKDTHKVTQMGRYMDITVQPAKRLCAEERRAEEGTEERRAEEGAGGQLLNGNVPAIRVHSFSSSDSSSSPVSSDLEWDFEETNAQWKEPTTKQQFPAQRWSTKPKHFNICTCGMSGLSQETLSGTEDGERYSSIRLT